MLTLVIDKKAVGLALALVFVWGSLASWATNSAVPTKPYTFSSGQVISSSQVNSCFDTLYTELQGNVGTANILNDAISTAKLQSGAVTTAKITGNGNTAMFLRGDATWSAPASVVPTGSIMIWPATTAPTSWLICNGAAVSRTTYANLFAVTSTLYGVGDGSTTFNLPDCMGRVVAGKEASATLLTTTYFGAVSGEDGATLGNLGGVESQALTEAQLAAHTHTLASPWAVGAAGYYVGNTGTTAALLTATGSAGSGTAHNNVQPTIIMQYIIKY